MLKLLKGLLLILLLAGTGFLVLRYQATPTQVIPYPYILNIKNIEGQNEAQKSHVLIVGDRMAKALNRFIPDVISRLSASLQEPLKIVNWSEEHEGLHRTLAKLKSLSTLPPVIIYHGASKEFYEKKFNLDKRKIILNNFKLFNNDKISSIVMTFPFLSKFIYENPDHQLLPKITREDLTKYNSVKKQYQMELTYKIFEYQVDELINYVRSKDSTLVFITTPINLEIEPKEVCKNANSLEIQELQDQLLSSYKNNQLKSIYTQSKLLSKKTLGNARSHYIFGKVSLSLLKFTEAKKALIKSEAFDCKKWRGSTIFNNIMKTKAKRNNVYLIDFNEMVNLNLGRDTIFHDEIYPQHIYYQQVMKLLESKIKKAYQL